MSVSSRQATVFSQKLLRWFDQYGRKDLPWQPQPSAYSTWIYEIMLQQTQVTTVIPYFQRFMDRFPTVTALANAPINEVLALWTGLGYYARARNCHKTAQIILNDYQAKFPKSLDDLMALPGIGRSTAGAILSLAFDKPHAILDGNVKRVLCRLFTIKGHPSQSATAKELWDISEKLTPKSRNAHYTQAIMDMGATLCTRSKPNCQLCPFKKSCQAFKTKTVTNYPEPKPKKLKPSQETTFIMIYHPKTKSVLLTQRPIKGIWGGLWCFPEQPDISNHLSLKRWVKTNFALSLTKSIPWAPFRHTFTHFHLTITPIICILAETKLPMLADESNIWYKLTGSNAPMGFATPVKQLLHSLSQSHI